MATKKKRKKTEPAVRAISDDICPGTGGEHMPDMKYCTMAPGAPGVVDVTCCNCHASGSFRINPDDIQW